MNVYYKCYILTELAFLKELMLTSASEECNINESYCGKIYFYQFQYPQTLKLLSPFSYMIINFYVL